MRDNSYNMKEINIYYTLHSKYQFFLLKKTKNIASVKTHYDICAWSNQYLKYNFFSFLML